MDERLEERLAGGRVAGLDYLTDVGLEGAQVPIAEPRLGREAGTIVWPDGADIAPETRYAHAQRRAAATA